MFNKILIANRGEIAVRIIRSCKILDIKTVGIYSYDDKDSMHVYMSDEAICAGKSRNIYLDINCIIDIAKITKVDAIHPGYGFLSENADFAAEIEKSGIIFIGPDSKLIRKLGNKVNATNLARINNLNILPNYLWLNDKKNDLLSIKNLGYPLIIKSVYGGGGKGIRVINDESALNFDLSLSQKEAELSYKNKNVYIEKYLEKAKHIEFQIISDKSNSFVIGDRECSIQENYQKIVEETPVSNINKRLLNKIKKQSENLFKKINYFNIGTIEFLYENDIFYFLEINPRLQVEHTITESMMNIDLVKIQIELSYKKTFDLNLFSVQTYGHYIQCRINLKSYKENKIKFLHIPAGNGIRFDSHIYNGYKIPIQYDKLIGKLIVYGQTRNEAIKKTLLALNEIVIYNIDTNINILKTILNNNFFKNRKITTRFLEKIIIK